MLPPHREGSSMLPPHIPCPPPHHTIILFPAPSSYVIFSSVLMYRIIIIIIYCIYFDRRYPQQPSKTCNVTAQKAESDAKTFNISNQKLHGKLQTNIHKTRSCIHQFQKAKTARDCPSSRFSSTNADFCASRKSVDIYISSAQNSQYPRIGKYSESDHGTRRVQKPICGEKQLVSLPSELSLVWISNYDDEFNNFPEVANGQ